MELRQYARPKDDNGRGIHWFTTQEAPNPRVDTYIAECRAMNIKWVVFLNGFDWALHANDYLVDKLFENDMMPILRVLTHPTGPLPANLPDLVRHYVAKGVRYFQIHNEPNLKGEWPNNEFPPNMMAKFAEWWSDAAFKVIDAGGWPGFPGLATAGGEYGVGQGEDLKFFIDALDAIKARLSSAQWSKLCDKLWISLHNYNMWARDPITTVPTRQDSHCFKKFIIYDEVVREKVGRSLPILGTEGGTRYGTGTNRYKDTEDETIVADHTVRSFQYMMDDAPDHFFCFSPWVLASKLAGNDDPEFEETAWYRLDGKHQKVVNTVKAMPSRKRTYSWELPVQPPQANLWAAPSIVAPGQPATLHWTTQNVTAVTLNGAPVGPSGQTQVQPATTTTYTLRASPAQGAPIEKAATIAVTGIPVPVQPVIENVADQLPRYPRGNAPTGPYPTRPLSQITMLVVHHTAWDDATPMKLAEWLVDRKHWPGIGYHFMIMRDGRIYQTNHLETVSFHSYDGVDPYTAPQNWDDKSVGVAFVGTFTAPGRLPTQQQLESGGKLCAWLLQRLNLAEDAIWGRCELMTDPELLLRNPSPGCVRSAGKWVWTWEDALRAEVRKYLVTVGPEPTAPFYHYLLFWKHPSDWAQEDWRGAQEYIERFLPTCGFSVEEAKKYTYVSIVGGPFGVPSSDEEALRAAGCKVERIAGEGFEGTTALLRQMASEDRRFLNPNL